MTRLPRLPRTRQERLLIRLPRVPVSRPSGRPIYVRRDDEVSKRVGGLRLWMKVDEVRHMLIYWVRKGERAPEVSPNVALKALGAQ